MSPFSLPVRWQAFQKEGGNVFGGLIPGHLQGEKMVSVQGAKKGLRAYSLVRLRGRNSVYKFISSRTEY